MERKWRGNRESKRDKKKERKIEEIQQEREN